jgi:hypothetical protein
VSGAVIDSRVLARVRAYAEDPAHWYEPKREWVESGQVPDELIPGNIPGHVAQLGPSRAVFSWTRGFHGELVRHLSVSGGALEKYPTPHAAFTVATMLGFTGGKPEGAPITLGPGSDWLIAQGGMWNGRGVITIAQPIPPEEVERAQRGSSVQ